MISPEATRAWLETAEDLMVSARNRVDAGGPANALSSSVDDAFSRAPQARILGDSSARVELNARAPELGERLRSFFEWSPADEGRLRAQVAALTAPFGDRHLDLAAVLKRWRSVDAQARSEAQHQLERALDPIASGYVRLTEGLVPPASPTPKPTAKASTTNSGLLLPSALMVEQIALGVFDPAALQPQVQVVAEPEAEGSEADLSLGPWVRALAEAILGRAPADWAELACAAAGTSVADFTPRPLLLFAELGQVPALPFGAPGVPWARGRAAIHPNAEADRLLAHGFGVGALRGGWALGGALAFSFATPTFVKLGLAHEPTDRLRALRTLAFGLAQVGFERTLGAAQLTPARQQKSWSLAVGVEQPRVWAQLANAESRLHRLPGEGRALYPKGGPAMRKAWLRGVSAAMSLRDHFDEDWWRNPRAKLEVVLERIATVTEAGPAEAMSWIRSAAQL